jgi:hypothetical protein
MSSNPGRRALAALAVVALVATAGCASFVGSTDGGAPEIQTDDSSSNAAGTGSGPAAQSGGEQSAAGRTIAVNAEGAVTAEPDRAVLHVAVSTTADSASAAREQLAENVSSLREALLDAGIPEENVTTEHYDIRRDRERHNPAPEGETSTTYRGVHAFAVEVSDVSRVGEIIRVAVDNGATDIRHVEFTLSETKRDELRDRALTRAMKNAREDADVVAAAADLTVDGVRTISTGGADVRPYRAELTAAAAAGDAATSIDSGPVTVSAHVQVTYDATGESG